MPMLEEKEYAQFVWTVFLGPNEEGEGKSPDESFRIKQHARKEALDLYERLTGFRETNINAIWHHRLSICGPPCGWCGKPLRTPKAKFCAACGTKVTSLGGSE